MSRKRKFHDPTMYGLDSGRYEGLNPLKGGEEAVDPIDEGDNDGGAMSDASEADMGRWAERYDDLNGAPESDEDR